MSNRKTRTVGVEKSSDENSTAPFTPSWIDRIVSAIERLPISTWLFYVIALIAIVLLDNAIFWLDGSLRLGQLDSDLSVFALYALYWVALYHYLSRQASRSLLRFRPLLRVTDTEFDRLDFELVNLPRNQGLVALLLGVAIAIADTMDDPTSSIGPIAAFAQTILPTVYYTLGGTFIGATFVAFLLRTLRQLRLVGSLHKQAYRIDLLALDAPHAFSGLTARTGLGLTILLILVVLPTLWESQSGLQITFLDVALYSVIAALAVTVFVVPLEGMHKRLQEEREAALLEFETLYSSAKERLYEEVKNGNYGKMAQTKDAITALMIHRERLDKISTWPWDPQTIRGFSSALLLPIFLLLVGKLLETLF